MGNITLLYENKSDAAALDGGSWALPLSNLTTTRLEQVARSASTATEDTQFTVALTSAQTFPAIVLGPTNLDTAYRYRIRTYDDGTFADVDYDSDWITPFAGSAAGALELEWENPFFWLGIEPYDDAERGIWLIHIFDAQVTGQFWSIELDNISNADGYVQAGRLFMANSWVPSINYSYDGNVFTFGDNTLMAQTLGGQKEFYRRTAPRRLGFQIDMLPEAEGFGSAYRLMRVVGKDGEVFVIPDPEDAEHIQTRSFFAHLSETPALLQNAFQRVSATGFQLEEIL